jgi:hypothetical protein
LILSKAHKYQELLNLLIDLKNELSFKPKDKIPINLFTHNSDVDAYNTAQMRKLNSPSKFFTAEEKGLPKLVSKIFKDALIEKQLELKINMRVLLTRNNAGKNYVNGSL